MLLQPGREAAGVCSTTVPLHIPQIRGSNTEAVGLPYLARFCTPGEPDFSLTSVRECLLDLLGLQAGTVLRWTGICRCSLLATPPS